MGNERKEMKLGRIGSHWEKERRKSGDNLAFRNRRQLTSWCPPHPNNLIVLNFSNRPNLTATFPHAIETWLELGKVTNAFLHALFLRVYDESATRHQTSRQGQKTED